MKKTTDPVLDETPQNVTGVPQIPAVSRLYLARAHKTKTSVTRK